MFHEYPENYAFKLDIILWNYLWNLLFYLKVAYFLSVSIAFTAQYLETRIAINAKISVFCYSFCWSNHVYVII